MSDTLRARSFGEVSDRYARYRPGPPPEALDYLLPDGASAAVDVGAGTGNLMRLLVERVPAVTAVEPDPRMRDELAGRVPAATALAGAAEQLLGLAGTYSAVIVQPPEQRDAFLGQVRDTLAADPRLVGSGTVEVPMTASCWRARRLPRMRTQPALMP